MEVTVRYRRGYCGWVLKDLKIDPDVRELVRERISFALQVTMFEIPRTWWPHWCEGILLEILGESNLDGGLISKQIGRGNDGVEFCLITIEILKRRERVQHGLSIL